MVQMAHRNRWFTELNSMVIFYGYVKYSEGILSHTSTISSHTSRGVLFPHVQLAGSHSSKKTKKHLSAAGEMPLAYIQKGQAQSSSGFRNLSWVLVDLGRVRQNIKKIRICIYNNNIYIYKPI